MYHPTLFQRLFAAAPRSSFLRVAATGLLMLQRCPMLKHASALPRLLAPAFAQVAKWGAPATVLFGGVHAATGASVEVRPLQGSPNPAKGTVGKPFSWIFDTKGEQAENYTFTGSFPPGVAWSKKISRGVSNLNGTPTEAGTYKIGITGWEHTGNRGAKTPVYDLAIIIEPGATILPAPIIKTQPEDVAVVEGASVIFKVVAEGSGVTFQWRKDGKNISGATGPELTIAKVAAADAGDYTVMAANGAGSVTSEAATLSLISQFDAWRSANWKSDSLQDPAKSGPLANPDGDDWANLWEFSLGTDPNKMDSHALPSVSRESDKAGDFVIVSVPKPTKASVGVFFEALGVDKNGKPEWRAVAPGEDTVISESEKAVTLRLPAKTGLSLLRVGVRLK